MLVHAALIGTAVLSTLVGNAFAAPPDVTFLCDTDFPEICQNMCWATRCASPTFSKSLTFDDPSSSKKRERRKSAGCGSGNRCGDSKKDGYRGPPNTSCDEYPFASTSEADQGHQVSRCVPPSEQDKQGGKLSATKTKVRKEGRSDFLINFGNPGNTQFCDNSPCKNDGYQVQDGQVKSKRSEPPMFKYYTTSSGIILGSLDTMEIGSNFTRALGSQEKTQGHLDNWVESVEEGDFRMTDDAVLEELPWDHFLKSS